MCFQEFCQELNGSANSIQTFNFLIFIFLFFREREHELGEEQRERESQAGFTCSTEPDTGLDPGPWDYDLSQNQELGVKLEPPRYANTSHF